MLWFRGDKSVSKTPQFAHGKGFEGQSVCRKPPFCIPSGAYRPGLIHTMLVNNERYSFCKFQQPLTERALEKYPELYEEWLKRNNQ